MTNDKCGTHAGYQQHRKRGEKACDACAIANREAGRAWRKANPERYRAHKARKRPKWYRPRSQDKKRNDHLRQRYGISLAQRDEILEWQGSVCACCGGVERDEDRQWHVDHDHVTGQIRGIVCVRCNRLISLLGDSALAALGSASRILTYLARSGDLLSGVAVWIFMRTLAAQVAYIPDAVAERLDPDRPARNRHARVRA